MSAKSFILTRQAAIALREIQKHSVQQWDAKTAAHYMQALYVAMDKAANQPAKGARRQARSAPFLMIPCQQHFIIYDCLKSGVVILTILHQRRDIESVIANLTPAFVAEVEALKKGR